jgi:cell division protein FtsZ
MEEAMQAGPKSSVVKIGVIGVGGGGCNAIDMICDERDEVNSRPSENNYTVFNEVSIIAVNTDVQALDGSKAGIKIQLGPELTKGQGAGGVPEIGRLAAEESKVDIATAIEGLDMLFITCGMGGGTGTGASPVISQVAKEAGILCVGVVTKPFDFESKKKIRYAKEGMESMSNYVDTMVVIPNQRLLAIADHNDMAMDMFKKTNEVLIYAVRNISELIANKSYINVDFADVKSTMTDMGLAMFGFGSATGEGAAINAIKEALNNPLLADFAVSGSKKMLLHFSGAQVPFPEFVEASSYLSEKLHEDADFIWGISLNESSDKVHALIVAQATEDVSEFGELSKNFKKVEASDQGKLFEEKTPEKDQEYDSDVLFQDADNTYNDEVSFDEYAPAAINQNENEESDEAETQPIVIEDLQITKTEDFDEEIEISGDMNFDPDDKEIPAFLRRQKSAAIAIQKTDQKEKAVEKIQLEKKR